MIKAMNLMMTKTIMNKYLKLNPNRIKLQLMKIKQYLQLLGLVSNNFWDRKKARPFIDKGSEIMANGT